MTKRFVVLYRQCMPGYGSKDASKWEEIYSAPTREARDKFYKKELAHCGGLKWKLRKSMRG